MKAALSGFGTPTTKHRRNFPETEVVPFQTYAECIDPLKNGQVDAITGFYFTSLLNLNARGVKAASGSGTCW